MKKILLTMFLISSCAMANEVSNAWSEAMNEATKEMKAVTIQYGNCVAGFNNEDIRIVGKSTANTCKYFILKTLNGKRVVTHECDVPIPVLKEYTNKIIANLDKGELFSQELLNDPTVKYCKAK